MNARHLSQEAYLWYTLTSPDYVAQAKTQLQEAVDFMQERVLKHPFIAGYAPVPHWGGVMQDLLDRFDNALAIMRQGEFGPMQDWTSRMSDVPRGFQESNLEWLSRPDQDVFMDRLNQASSIGGDFLNAVAMSQTYSDPNYKNGGNDWVYEIPEDMGIPSDHIARNYEPYIFPSLPEQIPEYAPDPSIACKTGDIVPWTGVWVPSTGMGTAALAFARQGIQIMQPAYEVAQVREESNYITQFTLIDCTWHPVKPTGRMIEHPVLARLKHDAASARGRCESGQRCPREGWWFTPASSGGRRHFKLGEVMPATSGGYGQTIWQWDERQQQ